MKKVVLSSLLVVSLFSALLPIFEVVPYAKSTLTSTNVVYARAYTAYYAIHDVAVTNVTLSKTVLYQWERMNINVTVENQGDYIEIFNVIAYYGDDPVTPEQWDTFWSMGDVNTDGYIDQTDADIITVLYGWTGPPGGCPADIDSSGSVDSLDFGICGMNQGLDIWTYFSLSPSPLIGAQTVINLPNGASTILTYIWSTRGVASGNYTITAIADEVTNETDTADNTYIDGNVTVIARVGGIWIPLDKLVLLAPYISLASTILVATVATALYVKRRKKKH